MIFLKWFCFCVLCAGCISNIVEIFKGEKPGVNFIALLVNLTIGFYIFKS